jgi:hypothetical protein
MAAHVKTEYAIKFYLMMLLLLSVNPALAIEKLDCGGTEAIFGVGLSPISKSLLSFLGQPKHI